MAGLFFDQNEEIFVAIRDGDPAWFKMVWQPFFDGWEIEMDSRTVAVVIAAMELLDARRPS